MFKSSKPSSASSSVKINGQTKATTTQYSNGSSSTNYYMSPYEQDAYNYAQSQFASGLKNLNVFSPEVLKELNDSVEAYKSKGISQINQIYNPMLQNLQNNVASRFGNLDNSIFLDKLKQIENSRAQSISALAQDITAREQQLRQNELAGRHDYLSLLNNYQNQIYQNAIGGTGNNMPSYQRSSQNENQFGNQLTNMLMNTLFAVIPMI